MALTVGVFLLLFGAGLWAFTRMGHRFAMVERGVGLVKKKRRIAFSVFFFNDTATTEIYTLSLHDALPICACKGCHIFVFQACAACPYRDDRCNCFHMSH